MALTRPTSPVEHAMCQSPAIAPPVATRQPVATRALAVCPSEPGWACGGVGVRGCAGAMGSDGQGGGRRSGV
ncbi:hypothetical protein T492DRAFT_971119 [Pavlovales sp. CCMP2436]|nr:hypothetical protein T492DRAFT_971119 [Pavlovales sp. CCMP2436]